MLTNYVQEHLPKSIQPHLKWLTIYTQHQHECAKRLLWKQAIMHAIKYNLALHIFCCCLRPM